MASIERYVLAKRDGPGRVRRVVRYRIRYCDPDGRATARRSRGGTTPSGAASRSRRR
jgi:hypothetical protein